MKPAFRSVLVPVRVRRPAVTRKTLRGDPLMEAGRANPAGIERIPVMPAGTRPAIIFARLPVTKGASDARTGVIDLLFVADLGFNLRVENTRRSRRQNCRVPRFEYHGQL